MFNRENPLSFNKYVVQVIKEEGRLMSMNRLTTIESQSCALKFQGISNFGQASNIGSSQVSNTKPSSNQASYQKNHVQGRKEMPRTPYGVISANTTCILERHTRRYMDGLQLARAM